MFDKKSESKKSFSMLAAQALVSPAMCSFPHDLTTKPFAPGVFENFIRITMGLDFPSWHQLTYVLRIRMTLSLSLYKWVLLILFFCSILSLYTVFIVFFFIYFIFMHFIYTVFWGSKIVTVLFFASDSMTHWILEYIFIDISYIYTWIYFFFNFLSLENCLNKIHLWIFL